MREGFVLVLRVTAPVVGFSLRGALSRFIHKRGGGAGGGGGARRPVESWRCSRDEVMLVDCWEPAMGIKVMKGHMQKRGESTIGIRNRRRFSFFSVCVLWPLCILGGGCDKQRRLFAFPHLCFDTCRAPTLTFGRTSTELVDRFQAFKVN